MVEFNKDLYFTSDIISILDYFATPISFVSSTSIRACTVFRLRNIQKIHRKKNIVLYRMTLTEILSSREKFYAGAGIKSTYLKHDNYSHFATLTIKVEKKSWNSHSTFKLASNDNVLLEKWTEVLNVIREYIACNVHELSTLQSRCAGNLNQFDDRAGAWSIDIEKKIKMHPVEVTRVWCTIKAA